MRLSQEQIVKSLGAMPGWQLSSNTIRKDFVFANFTESVSFVSRTVEPANTLDHHPDIDIRYNRVTITLSTHDEGGVTPKDLQLAQIIDTLV